jgi:4-hydroxybenzoate polyprenyltransferase
MIQIAMTDQYKSAHLVADAPDDNYFDRFAPQWVMPYGRLARWDRPIGWWLLLWPCWFSLALAALADPAVTFSFVYAGLFWIGAVAMRGAGCTFNDLVDQDFDAQVARTRSRPLPSGQVSRSQAWVFLALQALVGLFVLLAFNQMTIIVGFCSLVVVAIYPFMKRITYVPQLFLGLAFSWGALLGWTAIYGVLGLPAVLLYAACICWTIGYDTFYAHQDKEDDILIGVKSTALLFAEHSIAIVAGFYLATIALLAAAFWAAQVPSVAFVALAGFALMLVKQLITVDIDDPNSCLMAFQQNHRAAIVLFGFMIASQYLAN